MGRFKDFDEAWKERRSNPPKAKVFGREYTLPPQMPAAVILEGMRLQRTGAAADDLVGAETIRRIVEALFGQEAFDAWLAAGISIDEIQEVAMWAAEAYRTTAEGESPAPETGQPTPAEISS